MTRKLLTVLALAGLVIIMIPACSDDDGAGGPLRAFGTVMGNISDVTTDDPVVGATVTITSNPFGFEVTDTAEWEIVTLTDVNGMFYRDDIPNGELKVEVKAGGYRTPDPQNWALSPDGVGDFVFELARGEDPPEGFEDTDNQSAWPPDYSGKSGDY